VSHTPVARRWRWLRRSPARWVVIAGALLLIGAAGGYLVVPPKVSHVTELVAPAMDQTGQSATMPSVVGLTEDVARRAVTDAGIGVEIKIARTPSAGREDRVVEQSPQAGEAADHVTLTLSESAKMPDVVGQDMEKARAELERLGAVVLVDLKVSPGRPARSVLSTSPAPGRTIPDQVTLVVAHPGDAVALTRVDAGEATSCRSNGSSEAAGRSFATSLNCRPGAGDPASISYDVDGKAQFLTAQVALGDRATVPAEVEVLGDGKVLKKIAVQPGRVTELSVGIDRRRHLTVRVTSGDGTTVVIGDPTLLGDSVELKSIAGR